MEWVLVALAVLAVLFIARGRMAETTAALAPLLFVALAAVAITSIWVPAPYEALADWGLRAAGLHQRIQSLDAAVPIDRLADRSADLFGRIADLFGAAPAEDAAPSAGGDSGAAAEPGLVERSLYPGFVAVIALVLRAGALAVAAAGMLAALALGWAAGAVRASRRARADAVSLEARVAALEARERGGVIEG